MATINNSVTTTDLPSWYQEYTKNLGAQAVGIAQNNNMQPLPGQSLAGFNSDQVNAFNGVRGAQGAWGNMFSQGNNLNTEIAPTAAKFIDYAQGTVAGPAMETASSVMPWAQGAQDAMGGAAQGWTDPGTVSKYMSPYTTQVVDNIARLGKRNWEDNIMPGVNSSMIGSGQFGSTRNADILGRAGVNAANDITGQQSTALQAGYQGAAGIFANDANRYQQQQQLQSGAAISGGNMMQGALSADANRVQSQQQLQATTALNGATGAVNALNAASGNSEGMAKNWQQLMNTDLQGLLNIGNQQQGQQNSVLGTAYANAMAARDDPWKQLTNAAGVLNNVKLPSTTETASSGQTGAAPSALTQSQIAMLTAAGILK